MIKKKILTYLFVPITNRKKINNHKLSMFNTCSSNISKLTNQTNQIIPILNSFNLITIRLNCKILFS